VDIEALLRCASELRCADWPNEDPYRPDEEEGPAKKRPSGPGASCAAFAGSTA